MFNNIKNKIIIFIKDNKWILLVSSFFVGWKFFLISVLFDHEFARSEESLAYTDHINSINACSYIVFCKQFLLSFQNYSGFVHLSYRLFFGAIGHLLKIDSSNVFRLSFYIGIIFLLPSLIFFLKNIETDKKLIAFLLFFLTLYNGGGSHGFWWVVPDFFAFLIIFIIFAIIIGDYRHWKILLLILIPVGFYTHTIFVYLMMTIVLFYIFHSLFIKIIDKLMLKKIIFAIVILAIFYIPTSYHLGGNPYGPETFIAKSNIIVSGVQSVEKRSQSLLPAVSPSQKSLTQTENEQSHYSMRYFFPGFGQVRDRYFNWIFFMPVTPVFKWLSFNPFTPVFIMIFLYVLLVLFYYKQYKILSLYFAALSFTLISSINEHADRSLPFIWPITFILYAYGIWFTFKLTSELVKNRIVKKTLRSILCFGIVIFAVVNMIYSYGMNQSIYFNPQEFINNYVRNIR